MSADGLRGVLGRIFAGAAVCVSSRSTKDADAIMKEVTPWEIEAAKKQVAAAFTKPVEPCGLHFA
eukprot:1469652-Prymnesium_polylepis.1